MLMIENKLWHGSEWTSSGTSAWKPRASRRGTGHALPPPEPGTRLVAPNLDHLALCQGPFARTDPILCKIGSYYVPHMASLSFLIADSGFDLQNETILFPRFRLCL